MVVVAGVTVELARVVVSPESEYQVRVPVAQEADSVELLPLQIVLGEAVMLVGAVGIAFTVTDTEVAELLHEPETQAA